ncbi:MAG TPA: hypothetical protein VL099_09900 [Candidatus Binatia bacterium]|nr:hypothetical protein [Candidatus Binatia bacterium]
MRRLLEALRLYWVGATGYRLRPWASPYLRWRLETFLGPEADHAGAGEFVRLLWKHRARLSRYLAWVAERRTEQRRRT